MQEGPVSCPGRFAAASRPQTAPGSPQSKPRIAQFLRHPEVGPLRLQHATLFWPLVGQPEQVRHEHRCHQLCDVAAPALQQADILNCLERACSRDASVALSQQGLEQAKTALRFPSQSTRQKVLSESTDVRGKGSPVTATVRQRLLLEQANMRLEESTSTKSKARSVWPKKAVKGNRALDWGFKGAETHQAGMMARTELQELLQMHEVLHHSELRSASVPPIMEVADESAEEAEDKRPCSSSQLRGQQSSSVPPERLTQRCELATSTHGLSKNEANKNKGKGAATTSAARGFEFLADMDRRKKKALLAARFVRGISASGDDDIQEEEDRLHDLLSAEMSTRDSDAPENASSRATGQSSAGREIAKAESTAPRKSLHHRGSALVVKELMKFAPTPVEEKSHHTSWLPAQGTSRSRKSIGQRASLSASGPNEEIWKNCRTCGAEYQADAVFCRKCGAKREHHPPEPHSRADKKHPGSARAPGSAKNQDEKSVEVDPLDVVMCATLSKKHKIGMQEVKWRLREFQRLDSNNNKILTKDEFEEAIRCYLNMPASMPIPPHLLDTHWLSVDFDSNGTVDFEEFLAWTIKTAYTEEVLVPNPDERNLRRIARTNNLLLPDVERIKKVFDAYDEDNSGYIDVEEFRSVLLALLKVKNPNDVSIMKLQRWWREIDTDCSGTVSFEEFLLWYIKYFEPNGQ